MTTKIPTSMLQALILTSLSLVGASCARTEELARTPENAAIDSSPRPLEPEPDFRDISVHPLATAVAALARIGRDQGDLEARDDVASTYRAAGYHTAALFFESSTALLRHEKLRLAWAPTRVAWAARPEETSERTLAAGREVSLLIEGGRYEAAVRRASEDLESQGVTLRLSVEWADAVLWSALSKPESVSLDAFEVAQRIFLTSLEESVPRPLGVSSTAAGYARLSDTFFVRGDRVSALRCHLRRRGSRADRPRTHLFSHRSAS